MTAAAKARVAVAGTKPRVAVAGTKFGRVYLGAFRRPEIGLQLAAVLAAGSERSRRCAQSYGVPLCTSVDQLPPVDLAADSTASAISAPARSASRRPGISAAPA